MRFRHSGHTRRQLRLTFWHLYGVVALLAVGACARASGTTVNNEGTSSASATIIRGTDAPNGMVVSSSAIASEAGASVLAKGGNAVDAAIATGFALAVTHPSAGNIGGGGFMVIRFPDGKATTIDFREIAPAASTPDMFTDSTGAYSSRIHHRTHLAVGVPGTVAAMYLAWKEHGSGKLEWAALLQPAIRAAR